MVLAAPVGMLRQILHELGEAARVLLLEARAGRIADQAVGVFRHAFFGYALGRGLRILLELLVAVAARARADARQGQRQRTVGVLAAKVPRGKGPLRQANDV